MPISTQQFTIGTATPTLIVARDVMSQEVLIHNHEHSANSVIYIGNSSVGTATGLHARATETLKLTVGPNDELYAISNTNNVEIHVLRVRQD